MNADPSVYLTCFAHQISSFVSATETIREQWLRISPTYQKTSLVGCDPTNLNAMHTSPEPYFKLLNGTRPVVAITSLAESFAIP